jgi:rare lipoprotein A
MGTILSVRNPKNDKEVLVKVTDRGPQQHRLMIDLSYRAAKELDIIRAGIAAVVVTRLDSMPYMYPFLQKLPTPTSLLTITGYVKPKLLIFK